jgi:opacity protein-like surface antigen
MLTAKTVTMDANVGQVSYGRMGANGEVNNATTVRLTPKVGFFLTNNLLVEGKASIVHNGETRNIGSSSFQPNKTQTTEIGTGVDLRYYPIHLGRFLPFATLGGGVQFLHQSSDGGFGTINSNVTFGNWQAGLGASFFLSPHLSLDGAATYQRTSIQLLNGEPFNFRVSNYVALNVGFKYYLPAKGRRTNNLRLLTTLFCPHGT